MSFYGLRYAVGGKNPLLRGNDCHKKYAIADGISQWLMLRCDRNVPTRRGPGGVDSRFHAELTRRPPV